MKIKIIIEENENMVHMEIKDKNAEPEKVIGVMMVMTVESVVNALRKDTPDKTVKELAQEFSDAMAETIVERHKERQNADSVGLSNKEAMFLKALQHKAGRKS